jgi:hypothetical protein
MFSRFIKPLMWLSLAGLLVTGCRPTDDVPAGPEPPAEAAVVAPPTEPAPAEPSPPPSPATEKAGAATGPVTQDEFTPPFPDRTDPFEPPKRAAGMVRQGDNPGETVELKGFVNVDGPRVVLAIDGVISPLAEGGEKYGVRVISIQPPSVVLQRGRSRWTASLE